MHLCSACMSLCSHNCKNIGSAWAFVLCWETEWVGVCVYVWWPPSWPSRSVWKGRDFLISFLISKYLRDDVAVWKCPCNDSGFSGYRKLHQSLLHSWVGMNGENWSSVRVNKVLAKRHCLIPCLIADGPIWLGRDGAATILAWIFCINHLRTSALMQTKWQNMPVVSWGSTRSGNTASRAVGQDHEKNSNE